MDFELEIRDGFVIELPISEKPWAAKHDWYYDNKLCQIYRVDREGRKIPLWLDLLHNSQHEERDIRAMLVIEDEEIAHIFSTLHFDLWTELNVLWMNFAAECEEWNIRPGEFYEFVSLAFVSVLGAYYDWEKSGEHKTFEPDPTNLTPGRIITSNEVIQYATLGDWFAYEYFDWIRHPDAPCGIVAETQLKLATDFIRSALHQGVHVENLDMDEHDIDTLLFKYLDAATAFLVGHVSTLLYYYPIPKHV